MQNKRVKAFSGKVKRRVMKPTSAQKKVNLIKIAVRGAK